MKTTWIARRSLQQHHALKQALLLLPSHEVTLPNISRCVDQHADSSYSALLTHLDAVSLHTVVGLHRRADLATPILDWAHTRAEERGVRPSSELYNAVIRGLTHHSEPAALAAAEAITEKMKASGVPTRPYTLQQIFRVARNIEHEPLQLLFRQLTLGAQNNRAAYNELILAQRFQPSKGRAKSHGPQVGMLHKAMVMCRITPNARTVTEVR